MDRDDAVKALHQVMFDVQSRNKDVDPSILEKEITEADYLVSGDAHLRKLRDYRGIQIVSPSEFLAVLLG